MNIVRIIWSELIGLFLDDEFLAIAILGVVFVAAALAFWVHAPAYATGGLIFLGSVAVLVASVWRGAHRP